MKVVQKVLSHGLLITFFIAVFLIYFYRVQLFPQWFSAEPSAETVKESASVTTAPATPAADPVVMQDAVPEVTTDASGLSSSGTETGIAVQGEPAARPLDRTFPQETPASTENTAVAEPEPDRYRPVEDMPAVAEPAQRSSDEPPAQEDVHADMNDEIFRPLATDRNVEESRQTTSAGKQPEVPMADARVPDTAAPVQEDAVPGGNQTLEEQLAAARVLFWNQEMDNAEKAYSGITVAYPENADAWGELGNVYVKLGRWSDAAGAFFKAANLLIDQGQSQRAANMLRVLYGLDAERGGELEERLKENGAL